MNYEKAKFYKKGEKIIPKILSKTKIFLMFRKHQNPKDF